MRQQLPSSIEIPSKQECKFPRCVCAKTRLGCAYEEYDMIKPHNVVMKKARQPIKRMLWD